MTSAASEDKCAPAGWGTARSPGMPDSVTLVGKPGRGRCSVATRRLPRGTSVLVAEPVACVLRGTARAMHCHWCLRELDPHGTLPRCSRCKYAYYCGRSCQQAHWRAEHSGECAALARLPRFPTESVLLAARVLRFAARDKASAELVETLRMNPAHAAQESEGSGAFPPEEFVAMAVFLREFVGAEALQALCGGRAVRAVELFSVLQTNAFSISDREMRAIGVGLYPAAAMLNHSCVPNTSTVFVGRTVHVHTVRDVEVGEELCVSYTDLAQSCAARRGVLQQCFGFLCCCPRCLDESSDTPSERARVTAPLEAAQPLLSRAAEALDKGDTTTTRSTLEQVVAMHHEAGAPEHSVSLISAQSMLFSCLVSAQCWQDACNVGRKLLQHLPCLFLSTTHPPVLFVICVFFSADVYPEGWPLLGVQQFLQGKLEWLLQNTEKAFRALREAVLCLSLTHPEGCPLMVELRQLLHDVETERGHRDARICSP